MPLIANILNNYYFLRQDFLGLNHIFSSIVNVVIYAFIPILMFLIFYLLGSKIGSTFSTRNNTLDIFIRVTLGCILSCTGILILGFLGILYSNLLYLYYILLIAYAVYPPHTLSKRVTNTLSIFKIYKEQFVKNKLVNIAILGFILVAFIKTTRSSYNVSLLVKFR